MTDAYRMIAIVFVPSTPFLAGFILALVLALFVYSLFKD